MKKTYRHDKESVTEALGFTDKQWTKVIDKFNTQMAGEENLYAAGSRVSRASENLEKFVLKSPAHLRLICSEYTRMSQLSSLINQEGTE